MKVTSRSQEVRRTSQRNSRTVYPRKHCFAKNSLPVENKAFLNYNPLTLEPLHLIRWEL